MIYAKNWKNQVLVVEEDVGRFAPAERYSADGYEVGDIVELISAAFGIPWKGREKALFIVLKSVGQTITLQGIWNNIVITVTDNEELAGGLRSLGLPVFQSGAWHILPTYTLREVDKSLHEWDKVLQVHDQYYTDGVTILEGLEQANWGRRNDLREER